VAWPGDRFGDPLVSCDFNGDGFADLAAGVVYKQGYGRPGDAGQVNVIYGSGLGLRPGEQRWTQDSPSVEDWSELGDVFGASLAAGDFNGDGYCDLAIGAPGENHSAGAVNVIYGSACGLEARATGWLGLLCRSIRDQVWTQDSPGVNDHAEEGDAFGMSLATGDFNGDGLADLAIGVPGEDVDRADQGQLNVLFGCGGSGLCGSGYGVLNGDAYGTFAFDVVAVGDFDGDGQSDLAARVRHRDLIEVAVDVFSTCSSGVMCRQRRLLDTFTELGTVDSLLAGDFNRDGRSDLAIGRTFSSSSPTSKGVWVYHACGEEEFCEPRRWTQDTAGVVGRSEGGDDFGRRLTGGDFNGDGQVDLAVGVPGESLEYVGRTAREAGFVNVLYACGTTGLCAAGNQGWSQDSGGVLGGAEDRDRLGNALAAGDFNGDGFADLAIGVPLEDLWLRNSAGTSYSVEDAGYVSIIYGCGPGGLCATRNQGWHQDGLQTAP
jgi:hypothetical protein